MTPKGSQLDKALKEAACKPESFKHGYMKKIDLQF